MEVLFKASFVRQLHKLPKSLQEEVIEKIEYFKKIENHKSLKVHKLKGKLKDFFSFSVNYQYRIVFEFDKQKNAHFLSIGDHDVYK